MQNLWKILALTILLAGCSATPEIINPAEYDASKHARLRVYEGTEPSSAIVRVAVDCDANPDGTLLRINGWFNNNKQLRIGMTQTELSDKAQQKNGVFREFVIPAGKAVNIIPSVLRVTERRCPTNGKPCTEIKEQLCGYGPPTSKFSMGFDALRKAMHKVATLGFGKDEVKPDSRISFIPQAGHQYEFMPYGCDVGVRDITEEKLTYVEKASYFQCPKKE